jgi:hypothetical protein
LNAETTENTECAEKNGEKITAEAAENAEFAEESERGTGGV